MSIKYIFLSIKCYENNLFGLGSYYWNLINLVFTYEGINYSFWNFGGKNTISGILGPNYNFWNFEVKL